MTSPSPLMVIVSPPHGLAAIIRQTCIGIWLARALGRVPIVWWGATCLYLREKGTNCYPGFFQPPESFKLPAYTEPLGPSGSTVYPSTWASGSPLSMATIDEQYSQRNDYARYAWRLEDLGLMQKAPISILYSYTSQRDAWEFAGKAVGDFREDTFEDELNTIFHEFFTPSREILLEAEAQKEKAIGADGLIGIHYRSTDKVLETTVPSAARYAAKARSAAAQLSSAAFYVATDDEAALSFLKSQLGKKGTLVFQDYARSSGLQPLHYRGDPHKNAFNFAVDIEMLSRSDTLIGSRNSVAFWWAAHRRRVLNKRGPMLHVDPAVSDYLSTIARVIRIQGVKRGVQNIMRRVRTSCGMAFRSAFASH
jgi:hypothetical protein